MIGIDLFCGAGGLSLGAHLAGIDVVLAVDNDKWAVETYNKNLKAKLGVQNCSINDFKPVAIPRDNHQLIIFGGPPCQGFSTSNQRSRSISNPTNWLLKKFASIVEYYKPDWFVFENVKGILETEGGLFVDYLYRIFRQFGYHLSSGLLNSADFGVPQNRARFFLIGSLHGKQVELPSPLVNKHVTVNEAIGDLPVLRNGANVNWRNHKKSPRSEYARLLSVPDMHSPNHLVTKNAEIIIERYKHIKQGQNWESIPESLMTNYKNRFRCHTKIYYRLKNTQPSVVIGNYRKSMLIHPTQNRGLSVREAARIQSFPDWYEFMGSIGFQQQQVGNAVPPLLAKAVFKEILTNS